MFTKDIDAKIKRSIGLTLFVLVASAVSAYFGLHPRVTDVGYRPTQPIPFSHKLHADTLGIKCMYCHTGVEISKHSPVPETQTCMNCHIAVGIDNPKLAGVRESWEQNKPIAWRQVHKLPEYVHFNHSVHILAQIDCASCHGEVEKMGVVTQVESLTMGWCLNCHRNPEKYVVPARPISGIFTGTEMAAWGQSKPTWGSGRWLKVKDGKIEAIGKQEYQFVAADVAGIVVPKKPSKGPETCSACHY